MFFVLDLVFLFHNVSSNAVLSQVLSMSIYARIFSNIPIKNIDPKVREN